MLSENDKGVTECKNDHMPINTSNGWLIAEAHPTHYHLKSIHYIKGDPHKYGLQDVFVFQSVHDSSPSTAKIYIDNYWMSDEDSALYCYSG